MANTKAADTLRMSVTVSLELTRADVRRIRAEYKRRIRAYPHWEMQGHDDKGWFPISAEEHLHDTHCVIAGIFEILHDAIGEFTEPESFIGGHPDVGHDEPCETCIGFLRRKK